MTITELVRGVALALAAKSTSVVNSSKGKRDFARIKKTRKVAKASRRNNR